MPVDIRYLEPGAIYRIDSSKITPSGYPDIDTRDRFPLRDNNVKFIKILERNQPRSVGPVFYKIQPLNDNLTPRDLGTSQIPSLGSGSFRLGVILSATTPIPIVEKVQNPRVGEQQASVIGETELNKQKAPLVEDIISEKGIPSQRDTGPLSSILEMAGIKTPKSKFGGKNRRKTKKYKRKTTKNIR